MEQELIDQINGQVFKQFPYLENKPPSIRPNPDGTFTLKYSGTAKTSNGLALPISVVIKASSDGTIMRIQSSK